MNFTNDITSLGNSLSSGGAKYKANELFQGIKNEQIRLGKNPFVVVVNINSFDLDGLTDFVYLMDSFSNQNAAEAYAQNLSEALLEFKLKQDLFGRPWELESQGSMPYLSSSRSSSAYEITHSDSFKIISGEFDREYVITRVLKSNGGLIVQQSLFDTINSNPELWSYFVGVGESTGGNQERPSPFS